jgi:hypothetical protein
MQILSKCKEISFVLINELTEQLFQSQILKRLLNIRVGVRHEKGIMVINLCSSTLLNTDG